MGFLVKMFSDYYPESLGICLVVDRYVFDTLTEEVFLNTPSRASRIQDQVTLLQTLFFFLITLLYVVLSYFGDAGYS